MKLNITPQRSFVSIIFLALFSMSGYFSFNFVDTHFQQEPPAGKTQEVYVNGTPSDEDLKSELPLINAYPNPFRGGYFFLDITNDNPDFEEDNYQTIMYDALGKQVHGANLKYGRNTLHVDHLTPGIYFVNVIRNEKIVRTVRVVKG